MSLTASLQIGQSALAASQIAIRVTGDNLANAATPGYHRRRVDLSSAQGIANAQNQYFGRGVRVDGVRRLVDSALQSRIRSSVSDQEAAFVRQDILSQIETLTNDLDGSGVESNLREMLNTFNELANNPQSTATRSLIVEQALTLSGYMQGLRADLTSVRDQVDDQITANVTRANELLSEIADVNGQIVIAERGLTENSALRDQRDSLVEELAVFMDVTVSERDNGTVDVSVGNAPIVTGSDARGLKTLSVEINGEPTLFVATVDREEKLNITEGKLGGLLSQRNGAASDALSDLDELASAVIFEVNRLHSQGRPAHGLSSALSERTVAPADQALAFNDPANMSLADLPFGPVNGSFEVVVRNTATGQLQRTTIQVDLDGIDNTGAAGFGDDTTVTSLSGDLAAVGNLTVTLQASGQISISADSGFEFHFENDTSGALATLGLNTFFSGEDASDIGVRQALRDDPRLLAAGVDEGSNETALAISRLVETGVDSLNGLTLGEKWLQTTERVAVQSRAARTRAEASGDVLAALRAQESSVSGVSIDEESINLLTQQRQFQAAAQFVNVVDELTELLLSLV